MRRPRLVLGLGNPLMGDDGVGIVVADRLAADPRTPCDVEVAIGGDDLLRQAPRLADRRDILLVDGFEGADPGAVVLLDPWDAELEAGAPGAHGLSVPGCLRMLAALDPGLGSARVRLAGIGVASACPGAGLSAALLDALPVVTERMLALLDEGL